MYTSVREYKIGKGSIDELMHIIDEGIAEDFAREPGFVAYQVIDCGEGQLCTVTSFTDEAAALRSNDVAAAFVRDRLGRFNLRRTNVLAGEAMVSRAESGVLVATHH
jgi:hypothetical protein